MFLVLQGQAGVEWPWLPLKAELSAAPLPLALGATHLATAFPTCVGSPRQHYFLFLFFSFLFFFFLLYPRGMEVPGPGVKFELQLQPRPQLRQLQILNPLRGAGDQTCTPAETMPTL